MRRPSSFSFLFAALFLLISCQERTYEIEVSQQRERTLWEDRHPYNIKDIPPMTWRRVMPINNFRFLDYRVGDGNKTSEVYLSMTSGGPLENANRWLKQFNQAPLANMDALETLDVLGRKAFLIKSSGTYKTRQKEEPEMALLGLICPTEAGILTVKMLAAPSLIAAEEENFRIYCQSLLWSKSP